MDRSVSSDLLLIFLRPIIVVEIVVSDNIALKPPKSWLALCVVVGSISRIISKVPLQV